MTTIPLEHQKCEICKHASLNAGIEPCKSCDCGADRGGNFFEPYYDKICKWCYSPVAPGDSVCAEHRKSHAANSWRGQLESVVEDQKKQFAEHEIAEKKARRERIATALMAGLFANAGMVSITDKACANMAVIGADSLIAALKESEAITAAEFEEYQRGGKYGCEVSRFNCGEKTIIRDPYDGKPTCYSCEHGSTRPGLVCQGCINKSNWSKRTSCSIAT